MKYFKHLDALRGIMAMYVTVVHFIVFYRIVVHQRLYQVEDESSFLLQLGQVFMTAFFVISGFLITYYLLNEKEKSGTVNLKMFYARRAFRILPMYYLATFFIYGLYRNFCGQANLDTGGVEICSNLTERLLYYIFLVPNWAHSINMTLMHISNFWSIGAEEQFYLAWPVILLFTRKPVRVFLIIFAVYFLLLVATYLLQLNKDEHTLEYALFRMVEFTRFSAFAMGGLAAYAMIHIDRFRQTSWFRWSSRYSIQWACLLFVLGISLVPQEWIVVFKHLLAIPCCTVIIFHLALDEKPLFKLENKYLNHLGVISYSLYILNQFVLHFAILLFVPMGLRKHPVILGILCIGVLVLISMGTYQFIEKPFMNLRKKIIR